MNLEPFNEEISDEELAARQRRRFSLIRKFVFASAILDAAGNAPDREAQRDLLLAASGVIGEVRNPVAQFAARALEFTAMDTVANRPPDPEIIAIARAAIIRAKNECMSAETRIAAAINALQIADQNDMVPMYVTAIHYLDDVRGAEDALRLLRDRQPQDERAKRALALLGADGYADGWPPS